MLKRLSPSFSPTVQPVLSSRRRTVTLCIIALCYALFLFQPWSTFNEETYDRFAQMTRHAKEQFDGGLRAGAKTLGLRTWYQEMGMSVEEVESSVVALDSLLVVLPIAWPSDEGHPIRSVTIEQLNHLRTCMVDQTCMRSELQIIIGGTDRFAKYKTGELSGENVWARSSIDAFQELGHTLLYSYDALETLLIYQHVGHLVKAIFMEAGMISDCVQHGVPRLLTSEEARDPSFTQIDRAEASSLMEIVHGSLKTSGVELPEGVYGWLKLWNDEPNTQPGCIKRLGFEYGIPAWKLHAWHFWGDSAHPLGKQWTVSPEDHAQGDFDTENHNHYLGYSVEKWAPEVSVPKPSDNNVFILAKEASYFEEDTFAFWSNGTPFTTLEKETGMVFIAAAGESGDHLAEGVENKGRLSQEDFYALLESSNVMLGVGLPFLSPSPYDALARATPFINPILAWDEENKFERELWMTQHDALKYLDAPYVYNVFAGDVEGLKEALLSARATPIPPYTPPWMTSDANLARHKTLMETDWHKLGQTELSRLRSEGSSIPQVLLANDLLLM